MPILVEGLMASAQSLKHIYWSSEGDNIESLRAAAQLARNCPHLETLELCTCGTCEVIDLYKDSSCLARPHSFSLTAAGMEEQFESPRIHSKHAAPFDHATTLEFNLANEASVSSRYEGMPIRMLVRLFKNQAIEGLTVHGLSSGYRASARPILAPSLKRLDLRWSESLRGSLSSLHAPQLRELAIDGRLLPVLTPDTLAMLSSLTLSIVGLEGPDLGAPELGAINRLKSYHDELHLSIGSTYSEDVLDLLSAGFL